MNGEDWLPPETAVPAALDRRIAELVADWSARWFVGAGPEVQGLSRRGGGGGENWRGPPGGVTLRVPADAVAALGGRALDVPATDRRASDRELLEAVGEDVLTDLRQRLAALVGPADAPWTPLFTAPSRTAMIGDLTLGLTDAAFARLAREAMAQTGYGPLGDGGQALARQRIRLGASVGGARLAFGDLHALAIGDVVVLDHALDAPLALTADHVRLTAGRGMIAIDSEATLRITQTIASVS